MKPQPPQQSARIAHAYAREGVLDPQEQGMTFPETGQSGHIARMYARARDALTPTPQFFHRVQERAMSIIDVLKQATGGTPETVESLEASVANIANSIASQERILADREAHYGADLLAAKTAGDGLKVEQFIQSDREALAQMRAAHAELVARLGTAKAIREQQALDMAWDACEAALRARRLAFEEVTKAATALGKAQLKAEQAAQHAYDLLPVRVVSPRGAASYHLDRQWTDLTGTVAMMIAAASHDSTSGMPSTAVWTLAQQPTLVEQHDQAAALWLSARNTPSFNNAA